MKIYSTRRNTNSIDYWVGRNAWVLVTLGNASGSDGYVLHYCNEGVYAKIWKRIDDTTYVISTMATNMLDDPEHVNSSWIQDIRSQKNRKAFLNDKKTVTTDNIKIQEPIVCYTDSEVAALLEDLVKLRT